jgi:alcohol dehydrogenase class IV
MSYLFNAPQTIIHGAGARHELLSQLARIGAQRVFFVTDPFINGTGLVQTLAEPLHKAGLAVAVFSAVQPDPTVQNVLDGLAELTKYEADVVVAVGGGSSIDAAKAIAVMQTNETPLQRYIGYHKIPKQGLPLIAIPTTAGTGSEATKVTVITDTERNVKMMILDAHLMPTIALVDYELTLSMPQTLTAHVGVDTLTHGIEAYVSQKANLLSDPLALSCINLVSMHLQTAWQEPMNRKAREGMAMAACLGGMAFTNSSVCLVHGMSRPLGAQFHLAHGLSNAILLPIVTRFSVPGAIERYATIARTMGKAKVKESDEAACNALLAYLDQQNRLLKIPRLRDCEGIDQVVFEHLLEKMATDALASGSPQNNPTVPTPNEIVALYQQVW